MSCRVGDVGAADDEAYVESEEEAAVASDEDDEESSEEDGSMDEDDVHPAGRRSGRNAVPGAETQVLFWQRCSSFVALAIRASVHESACTRLCLCRIGRCLMPAKYQNRLHSWGPVTG